MKTHEQQLPSPAGMSGEPVSVHTERYHFYEVQNHEKLKNTLFRKVSMFAKTLKKKQYKIQADGHSCEGEARKEDKDVKGIDNTLLLKLSVH